MPLCNLQVGYFQEFQCQVSWALTAPGELDDLRVTANEAAIHANAGIEGGSVTATDTHVILFGGVASHTGLYSNCLCSLDKATMTWSMQVCQHT